MSSRGRTGEEDRTKPKPQKKKEREKKRKKKKRLQQERSAFKPSERSLNCPRVVSA